MCYFCYLCYLLEFRATNKFGIMLDISKINGIIFDYGGTIDSNGKHWAEVIWEAYQNNGVSVTKEQYREAWVHVERYLATHPVIETDDNFGVLLKKKTDLQINYLMDKGYLTAKDKSSGYSLAIPINVITLPGIS